MTTKKGQDESVRDSPAPSELRGAQIICVIGGPSVGKGTQCTWLAEDPKIAHVSVGELLRIKSTKPAPEQENNIEHCMRAGLLVPPKVVQGTLQLHLFEKMKEGKTLFLIDGFPRDLEQARLFDAHGGNIKAVLYFHAPEAVMYERMLNRSKTSGRVDDTPETFKKRYQGFQAKIEGILNHFREQGKLHMVDCDRALDDVFKQDVYPLVTKIFSSTATAGRGTTT